VDWKGLLIMKESLVKHFLTKINYLYLLYQYVKPYAIFYYV